MVAATEADQEYHGKSDADGDDQRSADLHGAGEAAAAAARPERQRTHRPTQVAAPRALDRRKVHHCILLMPAMMPFSWRIRTRNR